MSCDSLGLMMALAPTLIQVRLLSGMGWPKALPSDDEVGQESRWVKVSKGERFAAGVGPAEGGLSKI